MIVATVVGDTGTSRGAEVGSGQAFLKRVGLIAMDSDRRFRYLSRNLTLKLEVISSSSSSFSQIIGGATWSTPTSGSSLEVEEDGDDEEDEADEEYGYVGGGVLTF